MRTYEQHLTAAAWVEILNGARYIAFDLIEESTVLLHWSEDDVEPALDAPYIRIDSTANQFAFQASGYPDGQRLWARARAGSFDITVLR